MISFIKRLLKKSRHTPPEKSVKVWTWTLLQQDGFEKRIQMAAMPGPNQQEIKVPKWVSPSQYGDVRLVPKETEYRLFYLYRVDEPNRIAMYEEAVGYVQEKGF